MRKVKIFTTYCLFIFVSLTLIALLSLFNNYDLPYRIEELNQETNSTSSYNFENEFLQNRIFNRTTKTNQQCLGLWLNSRATGKIGLTVQSLGNWGIETPPAIIEETIDKDNTVIIGHNFCNSSGNCFEPRSDFARIMQLKVGDLMEICFNGFIHKGHILRSEPIPETYVQIMDNWTGFPSFTIFTSYGTCKDYTCASTNQRWLIVMEK